MKKRLLYIATDFDNTNSAMRARVDNFNRIFGGLGYKIVVVAEGFGRENYSENKNGICQVYTNMRCRTGITYRINYAIEKLFHIRIDRLIRCMLRSFSPSLIMVYGYCNNKMLYQYCKQSSERVLITDVTDWFVPNDRDRFFEKIIALFDDYTVRKKNLYTDGIIAVSPMIEKYYRRKQKETIRVPAIVDLETAREFRDYSDVFSKKRPLRIAYTGAKYDEIAPVVKAVTIMNKNKLRVFFDIYGVSENDLETVYGIPDAREVGIRAHGVIAHDRLFSVISKADFTILLRQPLHCEKAGFSTKAAESMSCAVPVIMTSIGGTDSIIIDNVNGLLLKDNTVNSIVSKLNEIMNYSKQDIVGIKNGASDTADNLFSIEKNRIQIDGFIESIIQKKNRILI